MMYDEYVEKIKKLSNIKNKIYKFRFLILSILVVIIATVVTLLSIKGNTSELLLPENVIYGDSYDASCSAVFSGIKGYEHKLEGTDEWISGLPDRPGVYYVRAVSERTFGAGYSEEKKISIAKRELNLTLKSNTITYGEYPNVVSDNLSKEDIISNYIFTFDDLTKNKTLVNLSLNDLVIKNKVGDVVTDCYSITYNKTEINFNKLGLSIIPDGATKIYDGTPLELPNTYVVSKELGYDDKITVSSYEITDSNGSVYESIINPGKYNLNIKSYDINSTNGSTLGNYNITNVTTPLTIEKREILINTASDVFTYDGALHSNDEFSLDGSTSLAINDKLELKENNTTICHFGGKNNKLEVKVLDSNDNDISDYYIIKYNYGLLSVLKRDINVTLESNEITYDSITHEFTSYEIDDFISSDNILGVDDVLSFTESGKYVNEFKILIENNDDYNITYIPGEVIINKRPISIKPVSITNTYGDLTIYNNNDYEIVDGSLGINDDYSQISVDVTYYQNDNIITPKNNGEYEIRLSDYESANYDVTFDGTNTLTINKLSIDISLLAMDDVTYDGEYHQYYDIISNYESDTILPYDEEMYVFIKYDGYYGDPINAGTYTYLFNDYEIIDGDKNNYIVNCDDIKSFNILKKDITITPINFENKIYDGIEYIYEIADNNFVGTEELIKEDKIRINVSYTLNDIAIDNVLNAGNYNIYVKDYEFTQGLESNYNVLLESDLFIISPREITLKPNDIENKIYDGIEVIYDNEEPIVSQGSLVENEGFKFDVNLVNIVGDNGDYNAINATLYHVYIGDMSIIENDGTLRSNYDISFDENTFEIIPRDITILLDTSINNKEYDGAIYNYGYKYSVDTPIVDGEELIPEILYLGQNYNFTSILNVDTYDVSLGDVTPVNTLLENYNINTLDVSIFEVTPKHIEITPLNFENKEYDGIEYYYDIYENNFKEASDLISGDGITIYVKYEMNGEETLNVKDVGKYKILVDKVEYTSALEANYIIDKYNTVEFEIYSLNITITLDKNISSKEYDGYVYNYSYTVNNPIVGEEIVAHISYLGRLYQEDQILYVDTYDVWISSYNETDITKNYTIDISDVDVFEVTKRPVTIKPTDFEITYGDELYYDKTKYDFVIGNLTEIDDKSAITIENFEYNVPYPKNVGTYDIIITETKSRNYLVTCNNGTLTINKFDLDIKLIPMDNITYDGNDHIYPDNYGNYISEEILPYNERIQILVKYNNTDNLPHNAGLYVITYYDFNLDGESKDNYNINCEKSIAFEIERVAISLAPRSIPDKEYDGISVSYLGYFGINSFDIISGYIVAGESFGISNIYFYLDDTRYLDVKDANEYIIKINIDDVYPVYDTPTLMDNYVIDVSTTKTFTITKRNLRFELSAPIYSKTYDGTIYEGFTAVPDRLVQVENIKEDIKADIIYEMQNALYSDNVLRNAGSYLVHMAIPNDSSHYLNGAKSSNYNIDLDDTEIFTIDQKILNLLFTHTTDNERLYDGNYIDSSIIAYTCDELETTYDELNVDILYNGKTTVPKDAGTYAITFDIENLSITPVSLGYITRRENYDIRYNSITYTITKRNIVFGLALASTAPNYPNESHIYDGERYDNLYDSYQKSGDGFVGDEKISPIIKYDLITNNYHDSYIRNFGSYNISLIINDDCYTNGALPNNYVVDYLEYKNYEVVAKNLTVEYNISNNSSKLYDAKEIEVDVIITGKANNDTINVSLSFKNNETNIVSQTNPKDAGSYTISINNYTITDINSNITRMRNYNLTSPEDIIYTINKRTLVYEISGLLASINYDGLVHDDEFTSNLGTCDGPAPLENDITSDISFSGNTYHDTYLRNADTYTITNSVDFKNYNKDNYIVTLDSKTFTINKIGMTLTFNYHNKEKEYDGLVIQDEYLKYTALGLVNSDILSISYTFNNSPINPKDVGEYHILISNVNISCSDNSVVTRLDNYLVTNNDESIYKIKPREVTITTKSKDNIKYDGTNVTYKSVYPTNGYTLNEDMPLGEGFILDKVSFKKNDEILPSIKDTGTYDVYLDINDIKGNTNTKLTNYDITVINDKTFTIIPRNIKFELVSYIGNFEVYMKEYDGDIHTYDYRIVNEAGYDSIVEGEEIIPTIHYLGQTNNETEILNIDTYDVSFGNISEFTFSNGAKLQNYNITLGNPSEFTVTTKLVKISLKTLSDVYSGNKYDYPENQYIVDPEEKYGNLIREEGFIVKVKYYDKDKNEIPFIKDAGSYYIRIDSDETNKVINANESLSTNYLFALDNSYIPFTMNKLMVKITPTSYIEDNVEKFAKEKVYDRQAYVGYDGTQYDLEVLTENREMPDGEEFIITPKLDGSHTINVKDASEYNYDTNEYEPYILSLNDGDVLSANSITKLSNYDISLGNYEFVIKRMNVKLELSGNRDGILYYVDKEYDGLSYYDYDLSKDDIIATYDSNSQSFQDVSYTFVVETICPTTLGSIRNAGEYKFNIVKEKIVVINDNKANFNFETKDYEFTISKRKVDIMLYPNTFEQMYDGYEYIYDGSYLVSSENDFINAYLIVDVENKVTTSENKVIKYAGDYNPVISLAKTIMVGDYISNYEITQKNSYTFTITKRPLSVTTATTTFVYNGENQYDTSYVTSDDSLPLAPGDALVATSYTIIKNVGAVKNDVKYEVLYSDGSYDHDSYDIDTITPGRLTVTKKDIRLECMTAELVYNGENQSCLEFDLIDGLCDSDKIEFDLTKAAPSIRYPGSVISNDLTGLFKIMSKNLNDSDMSGNYNIVSIKPGTLTMVNRTVNIIGFEPISKEYNSKVPSVSKGSIIYEDSINGNIISADGVKLELVESSTEVGNYTSRVNVTISKNANYYNLTVSDSALIEIEIYKRDVNIITSSYAWEYDGDYHSYPYYDSVKRLVSGHSLEVLSGTEIINVGSINNTLAFAVKDKNGIDISYNYNFVTEEYGILEILEGIDIRLNINDLEYTGNIANITKNDATLYSPDGYDLSLYELIDVTINSIDAVNVGNGYIANVNYSYKNIDTNIIRERINMNVTFNIIPIQLKIQINTITKDYTGQRYKISENDFTILNGNLINGDVLRIVGDNEGYNGNISVGLKSYTVTDRNNIDVSDNYNIIAKSGKISVNKINITVKTESKSWVYDGDIHSHDKYTMTDISSYGFSATIDTLATIVNYGTTQNKIKIKIVDMYGNDSIIDSDGYEFDYSKTFKISYTYGNLSISKAYLRIRSNDIEAVFDGNYHQSTANDFIAYITENENDMGENNVIGTKIMLDVTCTKYYYPTYQITVTNENDKITKYPDNEYNVNKILDLNGKDISGNFNKVTYEYGEVKINKKTIKIRTLGAETYYTGNPVYTNGVQVDDVDMNYIGEHQYSYDYVINDNTFTITLTDDSSITNVGTAVDKYTNLQIVDSEGNDVINYFTIISSYEKLKISGV